MKNGQTDSGTERSSLLGSAVTRRGFLRGAGLVGAGAILSPAILGSLAGCSSDAPDNNITMGIGFGNQVLWRYIAQKKDDLLKPLGYNVTFANYQLGEQLASDFLNGKIDVCAGILNTLPALSEGSDAQVFLPIAWMKWGFPIVVAESSSLRNVADLQNKRLATFGPTHPSTAYWQAFAQQNYDLDLKNKVEMVEYARLEAMSPSDVLREGKADAAVVESYALSELLTQGSYRQIGDLRNEWSKISKSNRLLAYGGYVAKTKWIKANAKFVEDLIRLNYEALGVYKINSATVIDATVAYSGDNAPPMTKASSAYVADYLGYNDVEPERVYLTHDDVEDYKKIFPLLAKTGFLKSTPADVDKLFYMSDKRPR